MFIEPNLCPTFSIFLGFLSLGLVGRSDSDPIMIKDSDQTAVICKEKVPPVPNSSAFWIGTYPLHNLLEMKAHRYGKGT
jgi:hypothetical protein